MRGPSASCRTKRARCGSSAVPARARPRCCSPRSRGGWRRARIPRARSCWSGAVGRPRSCGSGWYAWARAMGRPAVRHWSARCTPTRSACSACTPPGTAIRRLGCWPAPSRTRWSATCWAARSKASSRDRAGRSGSSLRWRCRASPPSSASCCCAPPSGGSVRTSWPRWGLGTRLPSGPRRGGSSAATSRSRCCGARRGGERRRPRRPRSTRPSWWRPRSTRSRPIPSCSPPSASGCATSSSTTRRTSTRSRWSWWACSGAARAPCCWRAIPIRPS